MNDLLTWMLGSVLGLGAAWAVYRLALRAERCFGYNRVFLLLAPLVAAGLPLLPRPALGWLTGAAAPGAPGLAGGGPGPSFVLPTLHVQASGWAAEWAGVSPLVWLYVAGVAVGLGRLAWRLGQLHRATRGLARTVGPGYALANTGGRLPTSSFGRTIFWDDTAALAPADAAQVLAHEAAHVSQGHTYDVLWLESWRAVLWFNPFIYPLLRALALTHELLADRAALAETAAAAPGPRPGPTAYATLLARLATRRITLPEAPLPLLHSFTHSLTLTRIAMLKSSHPVRRWKQWLALPAVAGLLAVACRTADIQPNNGVAPSPPPPPIALSEAQRTSIKQEIKAKIIVAQHLDSMRTGGKIEPGTTQQIYVSNMDKPGEVVVTITRGLIPPHPIKQFTNSGDQVYVFVEEMPQLPGGGGNTAIVEAIQKNVQYPMLAAADRKDGRVFVSFVVTKAGAVEDMEIVKGLGPAYDEAVKTAIAKLPTFTPGRQGGTPKAVHFTVPIMFQKQP
ncbi:TonB family protein [Hymenobacter sp. PAMC 26628]|uniref:TonB family protein n=1 Tax=Hymenobacter sp. PAMC 26628 TaxID=1484118 RepID=UPI00076FFF01|nr:M56 family metallopeptidase [Hymenobacter sp. PAMC 26628]AMJ67062.1 hypothetical protein AXW84_17725 [Hymenobacter sp. PAMC 26628]